MFKFPIFLSVLLAASSASFAQTVSYAIGTYTSGSSEGIYELQFNQESLTVELALIAAMENPSFVLIANDQLIATNETNQGAISILKHQQLSQILSAEAHTCHAAISANGEWLAAANYSGGSSSVYRKENDQFSDYHTFQHVGHGTHPDRQEGPHAHWVGWLSDNSLLAVDLGTDEIYQHMPSSKTSSTVYQGQPGDGIRHLAITEDEQRIFVVNELSNSVVSARRNAAGTFIEQHRASLLPADYRGGQASHISLNSSEDRLYVANRGHNSIAVYAVAENDSLELLQHRSVEGDWPRMFLVDEQNEVVLVANQNSGNVVIFSLEANGIIGDTLAVIALDTPTAIVKLP
ncbi:lactonase family protein [uncultured Umboniibacter sp.]|uniref:lactonase family protein n=1 Tax=uncultured Umboniibacter sp. TaxID=1798917 RepID=UPI00260CE903|nr:lactonase family protein [uncultured Umboniibacter sp.]